MMLNNKFLRYFIATLASTFGVHQAYATTPAEKDAPLSAWVVGLSAGTVWESAGQQQTFTLVPQVENTYTANHQTHVLGDGELFFGMQRTLTDKLQGQLGLALAATTSAALTGVIWNDANPIFDNFTYKYQIQHTHVALKAKLLSDTPAYQLKPYISGSLGVGFNQANNFNMNALIIEAVPAPNFKNQTTTALTYTVGAGIQRAFGQHWQAGIGYEFADWGKSQLAAAPGQTMGEGLLLNHLYTNGLLVNLTYLV